MNYEPKEWVSGETITADGLNNIEEGIQDALECCEDKGFECIEEQTTIFDGTVESTQRENGGYTSDVIIPSSDITTDSIIVTFNGTEYQVNREVYYDWFICYGAPYSAGFSPDAFAVYPFSIYGDSASGFRVGVKEASTNTVKVVTTNETIETDECFEKAVKKFVPKNIADYGNTGVVEGSLSSNVASGSASHAEGQETTASGNSSHAEGSRTTASGSASHAEGLVATASGDASHAEGFSTTASGYYSHAQGNGTIARGSSQTAIGEFNVEQGTEDERSATDYAFIIGNGSDTESRSNAFAIKWNGTFVFANGTEITPAQFASLLALL